MKTNLIFIATVGLLSQAAYADCVDAVTCNYSSQHMGDSSSSADNSLSQSNQSNPSSNSNTSSGSISVDPRIQQSGNTVDQTGEQWSQSASTSAGNQTDTRSQSTGGNASAGGGSATGGTSEQAQSASSKVSVDASDRSRYNTQVDARTLFVPSLAQPVIPSINPAAGVTTIVGSCGPLFSVKRIAAFGAFVGLINTTRLELGHDDFKAPYVDSNGVVIRYKAYQLIDQSWQVEGHQAIYTIAAVNVAGSRQLGAGGGGSNMNWGQGQLGGSSAMQRLITNIHAEPCIVGTFTTKE